MHIRQGRKLEIHVVVELRKQPNPVFYLFEFPVIGVFAGRQTRLDVVLVRTPAEPAEFRIQRFHLRDGRRALFRCRSAYVRKPFAVGGEPHGDHRDREHAGYAVQSAYAPRQFLPVVYARHYDELRVHLYAVLAKPAHPLNQFHGGGICHQPLPHVVRIRVHGYVKRAEAEADYPLRFLVREVGQRDVTAADETEPVIVVLDVKSVAHSLRKLVDEAEHALVQAAHGTHFGVEFDFQTFVGVFANVQGAALSSADNLRVEPLFPVEIKTVEHVPDGHAAEGHEFVPFAETRFPSVFADRRYARHITPP